MLGMGVLFVMSESFLVMAHIFFTLDPSLSLVASLEPVSSI